jgi:hypothetical protein
MRHINITQADFNQIPQTQSYYLFPNDPNKPRQVKFSIDIKNQGQSSATLDNIIDDITGNNTLYTQHYAEITCETGNLYGVDVMDNNQDRHLKMSFTLVVR